MYYYYVSKYIITVTVRHFTRKIISSQIDDVFMCRVGIEKLNTVGTCKYRVFHFSLSYTIVYIHNFIFAARCIKFP